MGSMVGGMNGIGMNAEAVGAGSAAYRTAKEKAQEAQFADLLSAVQKKAEAAKEAKASVPQTETFLSGGVSLDPSVEEEKARARLQKRLKEACEGFESMLLNIMYKEMRNTVPKNQLFGDDNAHDIWQSMLDTALMEEAAKTGGIGLADMLYKQLAPQVLAEKAALPRASGAGVP